MPTNAAGSPEAKPTKAARPWGRAMGAALSVGFIPVPLTAGGAVAPRSRRPAAGMSVVMPPGGRRAACPNRVFRRRAGWALARPCATDAQSPQ
ncbi:hypothetical protein SLA_5385 [Streptomyces laurentii]|uniref:Uncharacterized protein n=1 Tax=Streptomyces laurentii TaxID=39478 RepID=A0A160P5E7_STRLU|nr:hypothetical protein SLA_5385 [Streptomyces laurentii]